MITINQEIEKGIKAAPLDADCDSFNEVISVLTDYVDEGIAAGIFESAIQYYLQILKSVSIHFVDDCHYDYFDDMYSPDYTLQYTCEKFIKAYNEGQMNDDYYVQLKEGMAEITLMEAFQDYGYPYVCSMK